MEDREQTIRRLSPELCEDWLAFFDDIAFCDHGEWGFCYCLEGHLSPKTQEEWTDPRERREKAIEMIHAGEMQGYLAYRGDRVVGWCNVNDRSRYRYLTDMFQQIGYEPEGGAEARVKVVFCFLVDPEYRSQGIAQSLLDRVCRDAAEEGYAFVEAYPFADEKFAYQYHGTARMYARSGFLEAADLHYVKVMRKKIK